MPAPPGAHRSPLPAFLPPQLATLVDRPPADASGWSYEMKWDGYRILARATGADVRLFTRNGNDWTARLGPLARDLAKLKLREAWIDGEIVVLDDKGVPSFQRLQNAFDEGHVSPIQYRVFDLPFHDGLDLRDVALEQRRARLGRLLERKTTPASVRFSEDFDAAGGELLEAACRMELEGLIGKRRDGAYVSGRSKAWIKLKCKKRQEFVVVGYTEPRGSRSGFGALLLGVNGPEGLRYAGKVGTGFDQRLLDSVYGRLSKLEAKQIDLAQPPTGYEARGVHWVKPKLVAEVEFAEWTGEGIVRQAVFRSLRDDKPAAAIRRERAAKA
ncbi:Multifunctional non-homologous end joining protein LigD [Usitatibacter rugosus]|uniref:DNA ligase (ATP) n=1 Tax=Usitatibacter rugosus TaxID=2732067 RepID=A0A6M4GVK7_9PROT|nr:non-homologous end-joining DNA ligase [Usitatibacter rugosus]QJR11055.1 Multifunctional non-homologous end joining protein LigD [Usitatibacter rugosus]